MRWKIRQRVSRGSEFSPVPIFQVSLIEPDSTRHQSHIDIEPVTGKVLRRAMRLQVQPSHPLHNIYRYNFPLFRQCKPWSSTRDA